MLIRKLFLMKAFRLLLMALTGLTLVGVNAVSAQQCKPLLIPGKRSLFQQVITHPGANLYAAAGQSASIVMAHIEPFSVFYVYERAATDDGEWLKVSVFDGLNGF